MSVVLETTVGDLVVDLFVRHRPRAALNFIKLCKVKYFNFCLFHSIEEGYIAQTGDPTGTGKGGESIFRQIYGDQARFFEMETNPKLRHRRRGTVSMVNNGEDAHGSQFFVTLAEELDFLDGKHTVIGEVAEGWETLDALDQALTDDSHRPYRDIWLTHTVVLDDPFEDPSGLDLPSRSPSPSLELLGLSRIGIDEALDEFEGLPEEEVQEFIQAKEATAHAHILEMVGDLRHAEERPPDNVLFVCKLNPVTSEEDLETIFSRFGKIISCEVIKDKKTGNSLQYAFIEFEKPEFCENAYFKMDNVLIDDRRIHVDFSQSVAKNFPWRRQSEPRPEKEAPRRRREPSRSRERRHRHPERDSHRKRSDDQKHDRRRSKSSRSPKRKRKRR